MGAERLLESLWSTSISHCPLKPQYDLNPSYLLTRIQVERFEVIEHTQPMVVSKEDIKWFNDGAFSWQRTTINPDILNLKSNNVFQAGKRKVT